ncbi:MAG: PAS domain S-box protein [Defluviicoccus sp.]
MSDERNRTLLLLIMAALTLAVAGLGILLLYEDAVRGRERALQVAVREQAQAWNRVLTTDTDAAEAAVAQPAPESRRDALLATAIDPAVYRSLGRDGRLFVVAPGAGGTPAAFSASEPRDTRAPPATARPLGEGLLAALGARAHDAGGGPVSVVVAGEGEGRVIAVFQPLAAPGLAVLAEIRMQLLRADFVRTALIVLSVATVPFVGFTVAFLVLSDRIIRRGREGEVRLRAMFENMRLGAAVCRADDDDFVISAINKSAERIDGVAREAVIGRKITDVLPWMDDTGVLNVMRRVRRTGAAEHLPAAFHGNHQSSCWREAHVYGLPTGEIVALYDDVTDRKRAEDSLRESEARWRSIIEMQSVAIVIVDHNQEIRFVNKAAEALFRQDSHDLIGLPFGYPITGDNVAEIEIIQPQRGIARAEMRAIPMRWGGAEHHLLFIQDVSAYKRAQGDLGKLFQAIEQSPSSVVITDKDGRIEYVNPKFTETSGYTYAEVAGKNPRILKSGHTSAHVYQQLWHTIASGQVWRGEFLNRKKDGELYWEMVAIAPVRDASGRVTHYVGMKEDITERKRTEEQLRVAQRLEVIGQLTGGIAHDFNNLLGIIVGNLQLLEEKPSLDGESRELIADAIWSAERGAQLTHRLLAFSRRQRLHPTVLDLNHVLREMTELLRRTLGDTIEIRENLAAELGKTKIDRAQLESAVLNLVVNARDAMPDGGTLTISTENVLLTEASEPKIDVVGAGAYVMIAVADTGAGMPPDVLDRIFEPFFTTKKVGQGSGLGLSMVYGFVRQSDGHIVVDSAVGSGTTVKLYLPRLESLPVPEAERPPAARRQGRGGGETILVVEDDDPVRRSTSSVLTKHGYRVLQAATAQDAIEIARQESRLDLVFTGVILPGDIKGTELARQIVAERPHIRVLLTSGFAATAVVGNVDSAEALPFLPKPYRHDELTAKIRDVLDR